MQVISIILSLLFIVGLLYFKIKMPIIKGKMGEKSVAATLSFLPKNEYIILNDLLFRNGNYTTQIDHIVISIHGIFVIETKNYKGLIYGSTNKDYWTQNIWGNKYSLYNPVFQNKSHINFLIRKFSIIREKKDFIYPVVVFINATDLQLSGDDNCVMWRKQMNGYIKSCQQIVFDIEDCRRIAAILKSENIVDKKEQERHKCNVHRAAYVIESKVTNGICPLCGGKLVLREGKYGTFCGCSNYPRCRYTR